MQAYIKMNGGITIKKIVLNWNYSPENFIKENYTYQHNDFILKIEEGKTKIIFENTNYDLDEIDNSFISRYKPYVIKALKTIEMINNIEVDIGGLSIEQFNNDGTKDIKVYAKSATASFSILPASVIIRDSNGNILENHKDKIKKRNEFIDKVLNTGVYNSRLQQLLNSYSNSLNDPDNDFFYLYEIRDGLSVTFNGKYEATSKLNITKNEWDELGRITNFEPYKEGRHRGNHLEKDLIPAPLKEKKTARKIAVKMIKAYIEFLNNSEQLINFY